MAFSMAIGRLEGVARKRTDFALRDGGGESVVLRFGVTRVLAKKEAFLRAEVANRRRPIDDWIMEIEEMLRRIRYGF